MVDEEFRSLRPHLQFVPLAAHRSLHEPNDEFEFVYFPNAGLVSMVVVLANGKTVEVAVIGKDGIAGAPAVAGLLRSPLREVVQISGDGFRVKIRALRKILDSAPVLDRTLQRYTNKLGLQVAQTAACNRLHDIDRRLSRWLLMAMDRVESGLLHITQDFLATMLGTDRSSVSGAASTLQKIGLIKYSRGVVTVVDRVQLEAYACECYGVIQSYDSKRP